MKIMTAKHTPGPWRIYERQGCENEIVTGDGTPSNPLVGIAFSERGLPREMVEANARLIAAAPKLLAAAEYTLRELDRANLIADEKIRKILRAAIAHAKGEADAT